jgi:Holliday junction DNA helicase RuvA
MFAFLRGEVAAATVNRIALDVNGIGFDVLVPDRVQRRLSVGQQVQLLTYCHIREDVFQIYGFLTEEERALFLMCLGITGIGPKVALSILSTLSIPAFAQAVKDHDVTAMSKAPGVGKKTAQRLILEMNTKMGQDPELSALLGDPEKEEEAVEGDDVHEALISLGCTAQEAKKACAHARKALGKDASDEDLVREALRSLAKASHVQR